MVDIAAGYDAMADRAEKQEQVRNGTRCNGGPFRLVPSPIERLVVPSPAPNVERRRLEDSGIK